MQVILSGGNFGGQLVDWPEGQTELIVEDCIYVLSQEDEGQALFAGIVITG